MASVEAVEVLGADLCPRPEPPFGNLAPALRDTRPLPFVQHVSDLHAFARAVPSGPDPVGTLGKLILQIAV